MKRSCWSTVAASALLLAGCSSVSPNGADSSRAAQTQHPQPPATTAPADPTSAQPAATESAAADSQAAASSAAAAQAEKAEQQRPLRDDVAQLMMVGVRNYDDAHAALAQGVGGIFIGSWTDPDLLLGERNIMALRREFPRPFNVAIDAEGGRVVRQSGLFGALPAPRDMAATMSPEQVQGMAYDLGNRLKAAGINVDFAPVLDVDGGPANGAIGDRSFSADPNIAAAFATAFGRGLQDAGVTPVFKHFPGHGRTSGDSHFAEVVTPPLASLKDLDLAPYAQALTLPGASVMVGHMIVPDFGDPQLPSTLDPAIYGLLRSGDYPGGKPFQGIIYTDDLSGMKAISNRMGAADAAAAAIAAGADVALWISTDQLTQAIDTVTAAAERGEIDEQQVRRSAARVRGA